MLDVSKSASPPTPNNSHITVVGDDDTWVHAVYQRTLDFFKERKNRSAFLHRAHIYDFLLFFVGAPFAFWLVKKVSALIESYTLSVGAIVEGAAYLYVFLLALLIFRMAFNYTRWAFPKIELDSARNSAAGHRKAWAIIALSIVSTGIFEVIGSVW